MIGSRSEPDWARFREWCDATDRTSLPATPVDILAYLDEEQPAGSTASRWAAAIRAAHRDAGSPTLGRPSQIRSTTSMDHQVVSEKAVRRAGDGGPALVMVGAASNVEPVPTMADDHRLALNLHGLARDGPILFGRSGMVICPPDCLAERRHPQGLSHTVVTVSEEGYEWLISDRTVD